MNTIIAVLLCYLVGSAISAEANHHPGQTIPFQSDSIEYIQDLKTAEASQCKSGPRQEFPNKHQPCYAVDENQSRPSPRSCLHYLQCLPNRCRWTEIACPKGQAWDPTWEECVAHELTDCFGQSTSLAAGPDIRFGKTITFQSSSEENNPTNQVHGASRCKKGTSLELASEGRPCYAQDENQPRRDLRSCVHYLQCLPDTCRWGKFRCPKGQGWKGTWQKCVPIKSSDCGRNFASSSSASFFSSEEPHSQRQVRSFTDCQPSKTPKYRRGGPCHPAEENKMKSVPNDCHSFYRCYADTCLWEKQPCPENLGWKQEWQQCVDLEISDCKQ